LRRNCKERNFLRPNQTNEKLWKDHKNDLKKEREIDREREKRETKQSERERDQNPIVGKVNLL